VNKLAYANVLDTLADYVDATEGARFREKQAALDARVTDFAARYQETTGEDLPASARSKLASLDLEALEHVLKIANVSGGSPESLGTPDQADAMKTASETGSASDRFTSWIMS
jgi:ATPase subunit of ABC transporter with duplicated ATPase domains